ncbi:MAG: LytR family transcriptional regulator [Tissierellia bacterium]|nr:LytR family transcriptional regulator [Tissierellia bacterium]
MRTFWKVFIVSFIFFFIAIFLGSYSYIRSNEHQLKSNIIDEKEYVREVEDIQPQEIANKEKELEIKTYNSLSEAFKDSSRINVVILGLEDIRTDTIIFASLQPETKKVNMISIPRDTYIHRKGYNRAEERKINAIYGEHGVDGVKKAVSYILAGVPVHHYIIVDYKGVENIIDSVGGVEVVVPFPMKYSDPTANPPVNINIKEGKQVLSGKKALDFLRYRKGNNNKEGYIDGDLGRIRAQQQFIKSFIDKVLSYRLPVVVKNAFDYINTDIGLLEGLYYTRKLVGIKSEDFSIVTLPGEPEFRRYDGRLLSYFIYNPLEVKKVMEEIYNVKPPKS